MYECMLVDGVDVVIWGIKFVDIGRLLVEGKIWDYDIFLLLCDWLYEMVFVYL